MSTIQFIGERMEAEFEYLGQGPATDTGGEASTMEFSNVDFGPAEQRKVVAIVAFWGTPGTDAPSRAMVSASINGGAAQIDRQQFRFVAFARIYVAIVSAVVDVASGPVTLTFEGPIPNLMQIHAYRMVGLVEYPSLVDAENADASDSTDISLFLQTKAGGGLIAAAYARNSGDTYTLTGISEDYQYTPTNPTHRRAGGSYEAASDEASHQVRFQNPNNNGAVIAVSYR